MWMLVRSRDGLVMMELMTMSDDETYERTGGFLFFFSLAERNTSFVFSLQDWYSNGGWSGEDRDRA